MKGDTKRKPGDEFPLARILASTAAAFFLLIAALAPAQAGSLMGQSDTIFRMGKTTQDQKLYPLYEYLRFSGTNDVGKGGYLDYGIGGWGRIDLGDKSFNDKYQDGDLQYGYVSYRRNTNNLMLTGGRQFVAEGVAAERIDGLYLRSDLAAGFTASVFAGAPVVVTKADLRGGDTIYGGRIAHSLPKYYSLGISALRTDYSGSRIREEEGVDLWFHPIKQVDITGRSSYNSITSNWMEHAYGLTLMPLESLIIGANVSYVRYKDYFYQVTTPAFSLTTGIIDPNEKVLTLGGYVQFSPLKFLSLTGEYKNYDYDIAGSAKYYGGRAALNFPQIGFSAGASVHRMDGETDRFRFNEYRVYAQKSIGKAVLTVDYINVHFENAINGLTTTYDLTGGLSYAITEKLIVSAYADYLKSAEFDNAVTGFFKVTYAFDKKYGAEGRAK